MGLLCSSLEMNEEWETQNGEWQRAPFNLYKAPV